MSSESKKNPLVSIVAICFNHEKYVEDLLESICLQTYDNIEIVILDDCSIDKSVEVIDQWIERKNCDCNFIAHKTNKGLCASLNEALTYCSGKYLQLIACDDVLVAEKIKRQVRFLEENAEHVMVCSNFEIINEAGYVISEFYYAKDYIFPSDPFKAILDGIYDGYHRVIHSPTVLVRKDEINRVGGFLENIMQEDFYMWLQITLKRKVGFQNAVLVKYRELASGLSSKLTTDRNEKEGYLKGHIEAIEAIKERASGMRLHQLVAAQVVRLEKLERLYIENTESHQTLEVKLSDTLNKKCKLMEECPSVKGCVLESIKKSIISVWKKWPPALDIYISYISLLPIGYKLAIKLNISYDMLKKARNSFLFKGI